MKIYYRLDRIIMVRLINCKLKGIDILVYTCEIIDCESVANIWYTIIVKLKVVYIVNYF